MRDAKESECSAVRPCFSFLLFLSSSLTGKDTWSCDNFLILSYFIFTFNIYIYINFKQLQIILYVLIFNNFNRMIINRIIILIA